MRAKNEQPTASNTRLSRRDLLADAALLEAGLAVGPSVWAASSNPLKESDKGRRTLPAASPARDRHGSVGPRYPQDGGSAREIAHVGHPSPSTDRGLVRDAAVISAQIIEL